HNADMAPQRVEFPAADRVPQFNHPVPTSRGQSLAVWAECHSPNLGIMPSQDPQFLSACRVPHFDLAEDPGSSREECRSCKKRSLSQRRGQESYACRTI